MQATICSYFSIQRGSPTPKRVLVLETSSDDDVPLVKRANFTARAISMETTCA
jgi:hypothetical protein